MFWKADISWWKGHSCMEKNTILYTYKNFPWFIFDSFWLHFPQISEKNYRKELFWSFRALFPKLNISEYLRSLTTFLARFGSRCFWFWVHFERFHLNIVLFLQGNLRDLFVFEHSSIPRPDEQAYPHFHWDYGV